MVGVLSQANNNTTFESPTWNNGNGNGNFIRPYLTDVDLDKDEVADPGDNCSPTNPAHVNCVKNPGVCANLDQEDTDGDLIGDTCDNCPGKRNLNQADFDEDGIGDACDGCIESAVPEVDSDADGVSDSCDNCETYNPYKSCVTDADCPLGFCAEGGRCSRQVDTDGDGLGDNCDSCGKIASPGLHDNSNEIAEKRELAAPQRDVCDPVPVYRSTPFATAVNGIGGGWDSEVPTRNPNNSLELRGAPLIGHDMNAMTDIKQFSELPVKTFQASVGFRQCDCSRSEGDPLPKDACLARCSTDPTLYTKPESDWVPMTMAFGANPPRSADLPRGAEISKTYSSKTHVDELKQMHLGEVETLHWSYWKDLEQNGGRVRSRTVDGQLRTDGLLWSHTLPGGVASNRDSGFGGRLRDHYEGVSTPYYSPHLDFPGLPVVGCIGSGGCLPWLNPFLDPDPVNRILPRGVRGFADDFGRLNAADIRLGLYGSNVRADVSALSTPALRELIAGRRTQWASPVEPQTFLTSNRVRTQFVAVESPWSGTVPIREFAIDDNGRIVEASLPAATGYIPPARTGAFATYSAAERAMFLVGGSVGSGATAKLTQEVWRFALDTGRWQRLSEENYGVGGLFGEIKAVAYDSSRHFLYTLGKLSGTEAFYSGSGLRLGRIDTQTGASKVLGNFPSLASLSFVSLAVAPSGTLVLATQSTTTTIQLFELNPNAPTLTWGGYASVSGKLQDHIIAPGNVVLPILSGTTHTIVTVTAAMLAARTGASSVPDTDLDGRVDLLDDCPATYNPAQQGCPAVSGSALYAAGALTVGNSVQVSSLAGGLPVLISTGTTQTFVGNDARIGTVFSHPSVKMMDRSQALGSVTSGSTVQLVNGATIAGAKVQNAKLALQKLTALSIAFPPNQGAINVEPNQQRTLAPGSYGVVSVKSNARLTLTTGTYYFEAFHALEPQSRIIIDTRGSRGLVKIYVKSGLTFRGKIVDYNAGQPRVLIVYQGTAVANVESSFNGTLVAPVAKVFLGTTTTPHIGAFFSKDLEVRANARVVYDPPPVVSWLP